MNNAVHFEVNSKIRAAMNPDVHLTMESSAWFPRLDLAVSHIVASAVHAAADACGKYDILDPILQAGNAHAGGYYSPFDCERADYAIDVLGIPIDRSHLDLMESCGTCWLLEQACFASERVRTIQFDDRQRLHCMTGQSFHYPSGWGLWHWHGVRAPQYVIEQPELISESRIALERNTELRRVMIERYGQARYFVHSGATLVHQDARGKLWRNHVFPTREPILIVQVRNSTPEPDGSFKDYFLRVPPQMLTATEAIAWTFGVTARTYRPRVES